MDSKPHIDIDSTPIEVNSNDSKNIVEDSNNVVKDPNEDMVIRSKIFTSITGYKNVYYMNATELIEYIKKAFDIKCYYPFSDSAGFDKNKIIETPEDLHERDYEVKVKVKKNILGFITELVNYPNQLLFLMFLMNRLRYKYNINLYFLVTKTLSKDEYELIDECSKGIKDELKQIVYTYLNCNDLELNRINQNKINPIISEVIIAIRDLYADKISSLFNKNSSDYTCELELDVFIIKKLNSFKSYLKSLRSLYENKGIGGSKKNRKAKKANKSKKAKKDKKKRTSKKK